MRLQIPVINYGFFLPSLLVPVKLILLPSTFTEVVFWDVYRLDEDLLRLFPGWNEFIPNLPLCLFQLETQTLPICFSLQRAASTLQRLITITN